MASTRTKDDPKATAITIPVAEGDDPWTDEEVEEIRQELLADIARMERAIEVAEAGLADLFEEGT
ncbi:MAG TPA: TraR/DksA family transcriptional regulator, partial [Propionicimonas sp.]